VEDVYASGMPQFSNSERTKAIENQERVKRNWELVGLKDDLDLSESFFANQRNYPLAVDICREDLLIIGLDLGPFRPPQSDSQHEPLPLESWLTDI